jgi:hypothetical protein
MSKTVLVISDIHLGHKVVEEVLAKESYDSVVFLGDYFDQFGDTPEQNKETALWLKGSLQNSNRTHLIGNHDLNYCWKHEQLRCSGFSWQKLYAINGKSYATGVLEKEDTDKLRPFCIENGVLFSHAGFSRKFILANYMHYFKDENFTQEEFFYLLGEEEKALYKCLNDDLFCQHKFFQVGMNRGGWDDCGGPFWEDLTDHTLMNGLRQIVGHTPVINKHNNKIKFPLLKFKKEDGMMAFSGINNIKNIKDLENAFGTKMVIPKSIKAWTLFIDTHLTTYAKVVETSDSHEVTINPTSRYGK